MKTHDFNRLFNYRKNALPEVHEWTFRDAGPWEE